MEQTVHITRPLIMVLEDDLLLAMDMEDHLRDCGFDVMGPFSRIEEALGAAEAAVLDGAVVDLNLRGELSFPVIDLLRRRGIPVIVCSGYAELPEVKSKLSGLPLIAKPWAASKLSRMTSEIFGTKVSA